MSVFKCKMCGGTIEFEQGATVGVCDSCGTKQTLPRLDDDRRANLYDRANHFRRNNEFEKASAIYEQILNDDTTDAEAYWSLILCRYGIEYVEDPATHKRVPTVNRTQFTSIFDDDNYESAIRYADVYQRAIYEEEAKTINEIQKGILAISQKEDPFDVFICYKETDQNGRRTHDSVLANDLYYQLTQEGFKVFFARITLEDKLGSAYEPYIFAALNSAKVMVVLGTKPEYFNAVWVKNEWSRYLSLVKQSGGKKVLIPAYRDMDPYDLPEEFSHLQAQDMSKLGFMQDLIRGIKKITNTDVPKTVAVKGMASAGVNANIVPILKRAFLFLEDENWDEADEYCEKVLDQDPENADAYICKLLAQTHVTKEKDLVLSNTPLDKMTSYKNALRFADEDTAKRLREYNSIVNSTLEKRNQEFMQAEQERRKQAAIEQKEREQYNALQKARDNATKLISSQIATKESLQKQIEAKKTEAQSGSPKKLRRLAISVLLLTLLDYVFIIISATSLTSSSSFASPISMAAASNTLLYIDTSWISPISILVALNILLVIFGVKLLKADGKPGALIILNFFTYGIPLLVIAFKALGKSNKKFASDTAKEIQDLTARLQQIESQIEQSRNSLREINQKLEKH